jgi:hypothetical protein
MEITIERFFASIRERYLPWRWSVKEGKRIFSTMGYEIFILEDSRT